MADRRQPDAGGSHHVRPMALPSPLRPPRALRSRHTPNHLALRRRNERHNDHHIGSDATRQGDPQQNAHVENLRLLHPRGHGRKWPVGTSHRSDVQHRLPALLRPGRGGGREEPARDVPRVDPGHGGDDPSRRRRHCLLFTGNHASLDRKPGDCEQHGPHRQHPGGRNRAERPDEPALCIAALPRVDTDRPFDQHHVYRYPGPGDRLDDHALRRCGSSIRVAGTERHLHDHRHSADPPATAQGRGAPVVREGCRHSTGGESDHRGVRPDDLRRLPFPLPVRLGCASAAGPASCRYRCGHVHPGNERFHFQIHPQQETTRGAR